MKDTSADELIQAIRDTYHNKPALQPEIARKLMEDIRIHPATNRRTP